MFESLETPSIQYSVGVAVPCDKVVLTLPGAQPPVSIDLLPWSYSRSEASSAKVRPQPILNLTIPLVGPDTYAFPVPGNAPDAVSFILTDSSGWGRAVGAKEIQPAPPSAATNALCPKPTANLEGTIDVQGESSECNTLNIFWRDISLPSSLYVISAGHDYQKAWRWSLSTKSGKLEWDLALPAGNRFLVTVAGRQYAGFEGPRTVAASNNQSCLSTRAKEISHQRAEQSKPKEGLSQGSVIGIAIGAAALVLFTALAVWLIRRRRAPAVRPGEINLQDEWQSASQEHHHVLPFLHKKPDGGVALAYVTRQQSSAARDSEPQQEIDADAPMRFNGPAPPSYNHVLWVTQPPEGERTRNSALMEAKSAILTATELSLHGSSISSLPGECSSPPAAMATPATSQSAFRPLADVPGSTTPSPETQHDGYTQHQLRPLSAHPSKEKESQGSEATEKRTPTPHSL